MLLAEWLTSRVEISIAGRTWPLVFTHRALLLTESITGINMLSANLADPSASLIRGLLYAALTVAGAECSPEGIGECIEFEAIGDLHRTLIEAWTASMSVPEPPKAGPPSKQKEKPTWINAWAEATSRDGLGLTDDQWLDMTPRQVSELQKLRLREMQREELLVGIIAATIENFSPVHPAKTVSAETFMLHKYEKEEDDLPIGDHIAAVMSKFPVSGVV